MTEPVKAKAVKPVKAWALKYDGKLAECICYKTRKDALAHLEWDSRCCGPIRVEIREVK